MLVAEKWCVRIKCMILYTSIEYMMSDTMKTKTHTRPITANINSLFVCRCVYLSVSIYTYNERNEMEIRPSNTHLIRHFHSCCVLISYEDNKNMHLVNILAHVSAHAVGWKAWLILWAIIMDMRTQVWFKLKIAIHRLYKTERMYAYALFASNIVFLFWISAKHVATNAISWFWKAKFNKWNSEEKWLHIHNQQ